MQEWAQREKIFDAARGWHAETEHQILQMMEKRAPAEWAKTPILEEEYSALVELACRYLCETRNVWHAFQLGMRFEDGFVDCSMRREVVFKLFAYGLLAAPASPAGAPPVPAKSKGDPQRCPACSHPMMQRGNSWKCMNCGESLGCG